MTFRYFGDIRQQCGCPMPENLVQTHGTDNSITCSWNAPAGTTPLSYTLAYIAADDPDAAWTVVSGLTDTTYTATGLEENAAYTFKVKMTCANGESAYCFDKTFITVCTDVMDVPYVQAFESTTWEALRRPRAWFNALPSPS